MDRKNFRRNYVNSRLLSDLTGFANEKPKGLSITAKVLSLVAVSATTMVLSSYALKKKKLEEDELYGDQQENTDRRASGKITEDEDLKDSPGEVPELNLEEAKGKAKSNMDSVKGSVKFPSMDDPTKTNPIDLPQSPVKVEKGMFTKFLEMLGIRKESNVVSNSPTPKPEPSKSPEPGRKNPILRGGKLEGSLGKSYRGSVEFEGFSSSKALSKLGTYTPEEAKTIVFLKNNGVNTSFTAGMDPYVEKKIRQLAPIYGFTPEQMLRVASMESGGNPNAISATGAIGVFQFTGSVANEYGITNRFDADQNIEAGMKLAKFNKLGLERAGIHVDETALYLAHQIGLTGSKEVLSSKSNRKLSSLSKGTLRAVRHNVGGNLDTVGQYVEANRSKLSSFYKNESSNTVPLPAPAPRVKESPQVTKPQSKDHRVKKHRRASAEEYEDSPIQTASLSQEQPQDFTVLKSGIPVGLS